MTHRDVIHNLLIPLFVIVLILIPISATCQNIISTDPSDPLDSESIFINPAVIPFQHCRVTLGMKLYQLGFLKNQELGLRSSYFSLSFPKAFSGFINFGLTGQNFSVPLYDQTSFSILIAKRPFDRMSIGIKYNLFTKSYHQKYFDLIDQDDPVFADGTLKLAHSVGVGLILFPWSTLSIGFSCDHLNRPDISLHNDIFKQPLVYDFGFRYSYRYFSSSIYLNYIQQHWQFNWIFESRPLASSTFTLGFVQQSVKFAAQFSLFNGISIKYAVDYPFYEINQLSNGSHQISFIYNLDYHSKIKELQFTDYDEGKMPIFNLQSQFFVDISNEKLEIISQKVVRTVDNEIPKEALKNLNEVELTLNDSCYDLKQLYRHGSPLSENLRSLYSSPKYSKKYVDYMDKLNENLTSTSLNSIRLITNKNAMQRANHLRDAFIAQVPFSYHKINIEQLDDLLITNKVDPQIIYRSYKEQSYSLNPESVVFKISYLEIQKFRGKWKLIVTDCSGNEIKSFIGTRDVPKEIYWDWRDNDRNLIKPDVYYYYFQWEDKNRNILQSQPKTFYVSKISRKIDIDLRFRPDIEKDQGTVVEIKLVN